MSAKKQQWSYSGNNGPHYWPEIAPAAGGKRQSPVMIRSCKAKVCQTLRERPLVISYDADEADTLVNNGHTVQVNVGGRRSTLQGGPLCNDRYKLAQFHFHWGSNNRQGSEHKVDGVTYAGELHLVHWNASKFRSLPDALESDDGLCVLAVFLKHGVENSDLQKLCDLFPHVKFAGESTEIPCGFQPALLLPDDTRKYWTYLGSLTTPPCYECVRFIVFKNPIHVCDDEVVTGVLLILSSAWVVPVGSNLTDLLAFRSLKQVGRSEACQGCNLADNFRPIMPLNGRTIEASFLT